MEKYFVPAWLTIQENDDKASLNNPGGEEMLARVGGKGSGLPFIAFLDEKGGTIVNSLRPAGAKSANIGHPFEPEEVDWFLVMVKKAAPGISPDETSVLERWLRNQKK